jgi:hypothetical protein
MKLLTSFAFAALAALAGSAAASPGPSLADDASSLPDDCRPFLVMPPHAHGDWARWARRVTIATCEQARDQLPVVTQQSQLPALLAQLDRSIAPAVALYRDAMRRGPSEVQFFARYSLGMAYANLMVRARSAIAIPPDLMTSGEAAAQFRALHAALEDKLMAYARLAEAAFSANNGTQLANR